MKLQVVKEIFEVFINRTISYKYSHHIGLVTFSDNANLVQRMTPVIEDLRCAFIGVQTDGGTALWKALEACEGHLTSYAARYPNARKRILVLSDGQDTTLSSGIFFMALRSRLASPQVTRANLYHRPPTPFDAHDSDDSEDEDLYVPLSPSPIASTHNYSHVLQSFYNPLPSPSSSTQASTFRELVPPIFRPFDLASPSAPNSSPSHVLPLSRAWASDTSNTGDQFISLDPIPSTAPATMHTGDSTHSFALPALSGSRITAQETCLRLQRNNIIVDSFFIGRGTDQNLKRISFA